MSTRIEIGAQAEERASQYLQALGYGLLERNFRLPLGEIDIIAQDGETVVFVEVRYRASSSFGTPAQTVGWAKQQKLTRAALVYARRKNLDCPLRFDVVSIEAERLEHIPNAF